MFRAITPFFSRALRWSLTPLVDRIPKWTPISDPDLMIVHVIMPKVEEVVAPAGTVAAPTATAEPEVVKKGKKDEDETAKKDDKKKDDKKK